MKKIIILFMSVIALLGLASCKTNEVQNKKLLSKNLLCEPANQNTYDELFFDQEFKTFIKKVNNFTIKFSKAYLSSVPSDQNVTLSPLSIALTLFLAVECGSSEVRNEILDAFDLTYDDVLSNIGKLTYVCNLDVENEYDDSSLATLAMNNVIWLDKNYKVNGDTLDTLSKYYQTFAYQVDFVNKAKQSNEMIQQFVKEQTKGLIDKEFNFSKEAFILMNTIYLKGVWNEFGSPLNFIKNKVKFKNTNGTTSDVALLQGYNTKGKIATYDKFSKYYLDTTNLFRITFIKPNEGVSLNEAINTENLFEILGDGYVYSSSALRENYYTKCLFPEFEASIDQDLKNFVINEFNIKSIFKENAFPRLLEGAKATSLNHVTKLEFTKRGIEGAALTYEPAATSAGPNGFKDVYDEFILDRDFLFVVSLKSIISGEDLNIFVGICQNL